MEEEKKMANNTSLPSNKEEDLDAIGNSGNVAWGETQTQQENQEGEILSAIDLEPLKEEEMGIETPSNEVPSAPERSQESPVLESSTSLVRGEIPLASGETKKTLSRAEKGYFGRIRNLLDNNASFRALYDALRHTGKTLMSQKLREEEKAYDDLFIEKLEEGFEAIDSIILNPRTFIKENPELVDAGRAKKINAQSIVHLSSHTQYVYEVDQNNDVTPMKILTINSDVDYQIYENRFVWSLINKAALFIEKRYHYILDHGKPATRNCSFFITSPKSGEPVMNSIPALPFPVLLAMGAKRSKTRICCFALLDFVSGPPITGKAPLPNP